MAIERISYMNKQGDWVLMYERGSWSSTEGGEEMRILVGDREKLREVALQLRKMVHHKWCNHVIECPRDHFLCGWGLSFRTAIAWEAANRIAVVLMYSDGVSGEYPTQVFLEERAALRVLARTVAWQCPVTDKALELSKVIYKAIVLIESMLSASEKL